MSGAPRVQLRDITLADADLLPFEFTNLADTVQVYVKDVQQLLTTSREAVNERNRQIEDGVFAAIADPRRPMKAPQPEAVPPAINFAPLENASGALIRAAERYKKAAAAARPRLASHPDVLRSVNERVIQSERQLTDEGGLPRRPWYRHLLYAPGFYTGYAVKTLPGVREAIEQKHYDEAEAEVVRIARALGRETALIEAAAAELERLR